MMIQQFIISCYVSINDLVLAPFYDIFHLDGKKQETMIYMILIIMMGYNGGRLASQLISFNFYKRYKYKMTNPNNGFKISRKEA